MRSLALLLGLSLALAACQQQAPGKLTVTDAWVRLSPVQGRPAAAYFNVVGGAQADRLIAVESPKAKRIELHEGGTSQGMATMRAVPGVDVPAGAKLSFAPGGNHAMLFDVDPSVTPNTTMPLTFRFASGATLSTDARSVAAGADEHAGH